MSDFTSPLLEPDTTELHPVGDIFLGRRLPEFKIMTRGNVTSHHLRLVGRYAICAEHDDQVVRAMSLTENKNLLCRRLAKQWHQSFEVNLADKLDAFPEIKERPKVVSARIRVMATMADRLGETIQLPVNDISYFCNSPFANLWRHWSHDPIPFANAHQHGCDYQTWTILLANYIPQLARLGFVNHESRNFPNEQGTPAPRLLGLLEALGGRLEKVIPLWDRAAEQVNVYAFDKKEYYLQLPQTDNVFALKAYLKRYAVEQLGTLSLHTPEVDQIPDQFQPYVNLGLPYGQIGYYLAHQITPATAERWAQQGCYTPPLIKGAQALSQQHPELGDGYVGWYLMNNRLTPQVGFGGLPPRPPNPDHLLDRPVDLPLDKEQRETLSDRLHQAIVPANWWQPPLPVLEIESELNGAALSNLVL